MRRLARACLIAVLPALALSAAMGASSLAQPRQATTILPGDWEYNYRLAGFLPAGKENKCLGPAEVQRFADGICTNRYRCEYDVRQVSGGKVNLRGVWIDKKGRSAPVTAKGGYNAESFNLDIRLRTTGGIPLAGTMTARRVSPTCSADAK